jgi:hypothetical protein
MYFSLLVVDNVECMNNSHAMPFLYGLCRLQHSRLIVICIGTRLPTDAGIDEVQLGNKLDKKLFQGVL